MEKNMLNERFVLEPIPIPIPGPVTTQMAEAFAEVVSGKNEHF